MLYYIMLYYILLYFIILYFIILYNIILLFIYDYTYVSYVALLSYKQALINIDQIHAQFH